MKLPKFFQPKFFQPKMCDCSSKDAESALGYFRG